MSTRFHILRLKPFQELSIPDMIPGVELVVPMMEVRRYNRKLRQWRSSLVPLLPGYAFAQLDHPRTVPMKPNAAFYGFLRSGDGSYCTVTDSEVSRLQSLCADPFFVTHGHKVGDIVRLKTGPDDTRKAIVQALTGREELVVLLLDGDRNGYNVPASMIEKPVAA